MGQGWFAGRPREGGVAGVMAAATLAERWAPWPHFDLLEQSPLGNVHNVVGELRRGDGEVLGPFDARLLGRHEYADGRPVLDGDYVAIWRRDAGRPVTYCRVIEQGGATWLVYWWWYAYNGFHWAVDGWHFGDWECGVLRVPAGEEMPDLAAYAQHRGAEVRPWSEVRLRDGHPVVFAALGSHASHFGRGALGTGLRTLEVPPPVEVVGPRSHPWAEWPGRWGQSRKGGRWSDSPRGPGRKRQWTDPHGWVVAHGGAIV